MMISRGNVLFSFTIPFWTLALLTPDPITIDGFTMGTTYHVTYFDEKKRDLRFSVDSLLGVVNKSISTYDAGSEVSLFNRSTRGLTAIGQHLYNPLKQACEIAAASSGAFDPTVMPLVNAWGFGPGKKIETSDARIDSIRTFVGFDKIQLDGHTLTKSDARVQLDFGGIGQGYAADVIAEFLKSKNILNFLVELGGEGIASGRNIQKDKAWKIGVLDPTSTPDHQFFKAYVEIKDGSFTTSGNYFNYRAVNGKKYAHTIDPKSGYPVQHTLLSASVFSGDCATADAWATAFMVMGIDQSIGLLKQHPELEAVLIFSGTNGKTEIFVTPGLKTKIQLED